MQLFIYVYRETRAHALDVLGEIENTCAYSKSMRTKHARLMVVFEIGNAHAICVHQAQATRWIYWKLEMQHTSCTFHVCVS